MLRKKEKAQGLVEFALILPFLLLALLSIIEAARIIWAYITVQTAAREAARYAITGKPYINAGYTPTPGQPDACQSPEGQDGASSPWICDESRRVRAIQEIAYRRLRTMALGRQCTAEEIVNASGVYTCTEQAGSYGVLVIGQQISPTVSLTKPLEIMDYPGTQGLNVKVSVFYNVEMLDPILDAIIDGMMGRPDSAIQVRGELTMQNEGLDPSLGNEPPAPLVGSNPLTNTDQTGVGPNGEKISSSDYTVFHNQTMSVLLQFHQPQAGPYNIYVGAYRLLCPPPNYAINTNTQDTGTFECYIDPSIPAGSYELFSTRDGQCTSPTSCNRLATAAELVKIGQSSIASIVLRDPDTGSPGNVWAPQSSLKIELVGHDPDELFNVYFNYGGPYQQLIASGVAGNASIPLWTVPNVGGLCPPGGTPCQIESRRVSDLSTPHAFTDLFIPIPQIVIVGGESKFAQGEWIYIQLLNHTPGKKYDVYISDGTASNSLRLGQVGPMDSQGNATAPLNWAVLMPGGDPRWPSGWPNGTYNLTSHPAVSSPPAAPSAANQVAAKQIEIETPSGPFITVDGGYTWPVNSLLTIRVHQHPTGNNPYSLKFGSFTVSNSFNVGPAQDAALNYVIPPAAASGPVTNHTITSIKNSNIVASRPFTVTSLPIITVLDGPRIAPARVLPDTTITISLTHHAANSAYQIIYAGVALVEDTGQPFTIQTDSSGQGQRNYSLLKLPITSPAASPNNYGIPYPLNSRQTIPPNALVATTTLAIDSADLKVTQVQVPATAAINTTVPMTVTIQNTKPVTISRYFDVDFYVDPSPLVPAYNSNQFTFPGDIKFWKQPIVAPYGQSGDTFSFSKSFTLTTYGAHTLYGYADTSDFVFNENNEFNNVLSNTVTVSCNYSLVTDAFTGANGTSPSGWTSQVYGPDTAIVSGYPQISSNRLLMRNDGRSTVGSDDAASSRGHVFMYNAQVNTDPGMDVRVQVYGAPATANFAKAGLEVRAGLGSTSAKVEFSLAYDNDSEPTGNGKYRLFYGYRNTNGSTGDSSSPNGILTVSSTSPVWLRIKREPNSKNFSFYYAQQTTAPSEAQWQLFASRAIVISPTLYVGLLNASYVNNTNGTADFDNFVYSNTAGCPAQGAPPADTVPPGLTICTNPLKNKSFEAVSDWELAQGQQVSYGSGGRTGSRQLLAHSYSGTYREPAFWQQFSMPGQLLAGTTLKLTLFYNTNNLDDGDDPNDRYYALIATAPNLAATRVTTPTEIARGDVPPDNASAPAGTSSGWLQTTIESLPLAGGVDLNSYAGQNLYLYFYNNGNAISQTHKSQFFFDDIDLSICTTQPVPAASTRLSGDVVLHRLGTSGPEKIAGVTVWAYAENGDFQKTFSIQNGKFNFYDLPAGKTYFLYAEYTIEDPNDPSQIETLTASTQVTLKPEHTPQNPLETRLDLFPVY